jgi:glycine betaine/proline transport system substrate-binding protein
VALVLVMAACSDVSESTPGGGTNADVAQCGSEPIRLAVNKWVGAEANAAVAAVVMEQQMGCDVELTKIDEFPQFSAMAKGDLDATLEVWPSVHPEERIQYIDDPDGGVVDGGELGILGNIGWFVPSYVLDEHPEFASWEGIKGNESYFATPESGDQGQFLGSDPAFGYFDEAIIESLGLDLKWIAGGSETGSLSALDKAFTAQEPLLMYFWSPHWALVKYNLVEVELPPFDDQCAEAALTADAAGYDCDYADDVLYKAFSEQLQQDDPAALEFLSNMTWTAEDQNAVALDIEEGMSPEEAGKKWMDANPDVWQAWLPAA